MQFLTYTLLSKIVISLIARTRFFEIWPPIKSTWRYPHNAIRIVNKLSVLQNFKGDENHAYFPQESEWFLPRMLGYESEQCMARYMFQ